MSFGHLLQTPTHMKCSLGPIHTHHIFKHFSNYWGFRTSLILPCQLKENLHNSSNSQNKNNNNHCSQWCRLHTDFFAILWRPLTLHFNTCEHIHKYINTYICIYVWMRSGYVWLLTGNSFLTFDRNVLLKTNTNTTTTNILNMVYLKMFCMLNIFCCCCCCCSSYTVLNLCWLVCWLIVV